MKTKPMKWLAILPLYILPVLLMGCPPKGAPVKLSFVLTNDIHGYLAPNMTYFSSIVHQLREAPEYKNNQAGLFVVDSGDQFQGTLLSNYDEGVTTFKVLNQIGYDAAIPGNHDYDFGPLGWLYDQVTPGKTSDDSKEVLRNLTKLAKFPFLSANTYYRASLKSNETVVDVNNQCAPKNQSLKDPINFESATRPEFLKPYVIIERAGVRVAFVGLDNKDTTSTTTPQNVSDLCFRDEVETYLEVRESLEGKADVFVILLHNGNAPPNSWVGSNIAEAINKARPNGVDLIASGHTHTTYNMVSGGVHILQDNAKGKFYGRVDLIYDPKTKSVLKDQTLSAAGIPIDPNKCDDTKNKFVCAQLKLPIASDPVVDSIISKGSEIVAPLAKKKITTTTEIVKIDRINESALGDIFADEMRKGTGADIAIMNAGGIRADMPKGDILYEDLFAISPFQNQALIFKNVPWTGIKKAMEHSIDTCGDRGTLVQSGLRIQYARSCTSGKPVSELKHMETMSGEVLFDLDTGVSAPPTRTFTVAVLDFIASGGDGYSMFKDNQMDSSAGIARELIINQLAVDNLILNNSVDGRYKNLTP